MLLTVATPRRLLLVALLLLPMWGGCDATETASPPPAAPADDTHWHYRREYLFVGQRRGEPLVVPFAFRATDRGEWIERAVHGWLARGQTWDEFLEEEWSTSPVGGVWRALPRRPLGLAVRGPLEVEALWYRQGDRHLRVELGEPLTGWLGEKRRRVRLLRGHLELGSERMSGAVVEEYDVSRASVGAEPGRVRDQLLLTGGDSLRLLLAWSEEGGAGRGFAWVQSPGEARTWEEVRLERVAVRPLQEARRNIPTAWRFHVPGAGLSGEVTAVGMWSEVGAERGGRREAEVRYTVEGWVEREGARTPATGAARHEQG